MIEYIDDNGNQLINSGDILEIELTLSEAAAPNVPVAIEGKATIVTIVETKITLRLDIITDPVNPVPEAGYALLHLQEVAEEI